MKHPLETELYLVAVIDDKTFVVTHIRCLIVTTTKARFVGITPSAYAMSSLKKKHVDMPFLFRPDASEVRWRLIIKS